MRVLIIADYLPFPLIGGDRIRIYNLLRRVAYHNEVFLATFLEKPEDADGIHHLQEFCTRVETVKIQQRSRLSRMPGIISYALTGKPPELKLLYSEELIDKIQQLGSKIDFNIVQIEHSRMGLYLDAIPRNSNWKSILMFHNFTSQQYERVSHLDQSLGKKIRHWINSRTMGYWEPRYAENFDCCTTVSVDDQHSLMKANPRLKVEVIPNGVDIVQYQQLNLPKENELPSIMFIGNMAYPPCVDAVLYFCREIFPYIMRSNRVVDFWIVGRDPPAEVLELAGDRVHVTGRVEDVVPYYRQSTVCVVPLRAGGGTRLKILEAMALGRPVVTTTIGCEGLDVIDGVHLLIADTPEKFAEKTLSLLSDRQLSQDICANARKLVVTKYDWNIIADRLMQVYTELKDK